MPRLTNKQVEEIEKRTEKEKEERIRKLQQDIGRYVTSDKKVNWRT